MSYLTHKIQNWRLKGNNVYCHCCHKNFLAFLPFGKNYRPNAQCPNCLSLERHRLIWLYLQNKTNFFNHPIKLLHVAPEQIFFKLIKEMNNIEYFPVDKFTPGYKRPKGTLNMDITGLNFETNSFDVILCIHVLEHITDDLKAMQELYRVLKKDGWVIIQVPLDPKLKITYEDLNINDPSQREQHFGQFDHVRKYGLDYKNKLEKAGFKVRADDFLSTFSTAEINKFGFPKKESIYYCIKMKK